MALFLQKLEDESRNIIIRGGLLVPPALSLLFQKPPIQLLESVRCPEIIILAAMVAVIRALVLSCRIEQITETHIQIVA